MKKLSRVILLAMTFSLIAMLLAACGKPSAASLGIEMPENSITVIYDKLGLGIYGQFNYDFDSKIGQIKIDTKDLQKIKTGYTVSFLTSIGQFGTVISLPNPETPGDNGKCTVEVEVKDALNIPYKLLSSNKTVAINLPAEDNRWCLDNRCILDGKDGKKYVWSTTKKDLILEEDWQLKEVKTGETDSLRTEILSGLKSGERVVMPFDISDYSYLAE